MKKQKWTVITVMLTKEYGQTNKYYVYEKNNDGYVNVGSFPQ